jgi:hypothetical protein
LFGFGLELELELVLVFWMTGVSSPFQTLERRRSRFAQLSFSSVVMFQSCFSSSGLELAVDLAVS